MADHCPFCAIAFGRAPATIVYEEGNALVIVPVRPVVEGHVLVIPREHVADFAEDPGVSAYAMAVASKYVAANSALYAACNMITSRGHAATQSVRHVHLHLIPRREGDGIALPWTSRHHGMSDWEGAGRTAEIPCPVHPVDRDE